MIYMTYYLVLAVSENLMKTNVLKGDSTIALSKKGVKKSYSAKIGRFRAFPASIVYNIIIYILFSSCLYIDISLP